jgi:hypothetical protein
MSGYTWEQIVEDYREAGGPWPFKKGEVAEWALAHSRWKPSPADIRRMCADSLADAMREASFTDETGREIRRMVPAKTTRAGEQGTFWDDLRTAPIAHVRLSVAQTRNGIVGQCYHLKNIVRYSNEHRGPEDQIELVLNMTKDVLEMDQPIQQAMAKTVRLDLATSIPSSSEQLQQSAPPQTSARRSTSRRVTSRPSYRRAVRAQQLRDSSSPGPGES